MGEIKSVKVDNWGVFFLQKLQNFFNKTDYCDLTLQFRDNSQLKVHRLVLSACTDFFNVLEQTCELIDDALVMPQELQADVVVPIVNFMYTGTLEFELRMYNKLLKTAKEMNMTVLLKLLEAHKRTMESSIKPPQRSGSPKSKGKRAPINSSIIGKILTPSVVSSTQQQIQRRKVVTANPSTPVRRIMTAKPTPLASIFRQSSNSLLKAAPKMQRGPTRFETTDSNIPSDTFEPSFDSISYESRPLKEEPEEYEEMQTSPTKHRSSPFEQLRKGYNNNKRPAVTTFTSPPAKKPNIEDVKEFSEQQRMRKQIAAEYGDDAEYDGVMDDDIHNDDDDEEPSSNPSSAKQQTPQQQPQASIIIKQSPNEKPTIVVKDSSNSKMDHAKIISEVLRQYPHLVKGNKNIKLKIMPNVGGQPQKIIVKKEAIDNISAEAETTKNQQAQQQLQQISQKPTRMLTKGQIAKPATSTKVEAQTTASVTSVETVVPAAVSATKSTGPTPKRRIDSKTMHALIAQGAANTTGPWLCLRCGVNGRPISIPSYRGFRRHLINTHKEVIDAALCEHCGWRSSSTRDLSHHMLVEHNIPSLHFIHPKCDHCPQICVAKDDLDLHVEKAHPDVHKQLCIYCNKVFFKEMQLYTHMKTFHKKLAREDGVLDFSEDELTEFDDEMNNMHPQSSTDNKKIKIISDIALPSTLIKPVEEDFANDSGPKFVNADGNEMVLTAEQREEIMSQLEQDHDGGVVMVLNEPAFPQGEAVVAGQVSKIEPTDALDDFDDANIYTEFPEDEATGEFGGQETSTEASALDGNKEDEEETHEQDHEESGHEERIDEDHMEWAENLISAHDDNDHDEDEEEPDDDDEDMDDDEGDAKKTKISATKEEDEKVTSSKSPSDDLKEGGKPKHVDDISMKLKELTGDWSDDEIEDDDDEEEEEVKPDVELIEKNKRDEDLHAELMDENTPEKQTSEDKDVAKMTQEIKDSQAKVEAKSKTNLGKGDTEVEISQSKQSETTENDEILSKEDIKEEILTSTDDLEKSSEPALETETSDMVINDTEATEKADSSTTEETKPRRTSSTDAVETPPEITSQADEDKSLDEAISEKPSAKISSPKKTDEDSLEPDEKKNDDDKEQKVESSTEKEDTVTSSKPTKDDTVKTVDEVKSLISDWDVDDDEI